MGTLTLGEMMSQESVSRDSETERSSMAKKQEGSNTVYIHDLDQSPVLLCVCVCGGNREKVLKEQKIKVKW